jgi:hypothetical protein
VDRQFAKFDKFDYYWPEFANLGEQPVYNAELYMDWSGASPRGGIFGYQSRYSEMKFGKDTIHGDFRNSLEFWHMGRYFDTPPALNADFVKSQPTTKIWPIENTSHKLYVQVWNQIRARRPMPVFGQPSL